MKRSKKQKTNAILKSLKYYNWNKALSYNALFNFIVTERGLGKTYGFLKFLIKKYYYDGVKSILLTKYIKELEGKTDETYQHSILTTLQEIQQEDKLISTLDIEFKLSGRHILINDKIAFSFYAISEAETMRKITELKTYGIILHDEFIRFSKYVKDEIDKLLMIYDTVDRRKNTTKLFMLANAITKYNIYSDYFNLDLSKEGYFFDKERSLLLHISNDEVYQREREQSAVAKLAGQESKYNQMASNAQFVYDENVFVCESLTSFEKHLFALLINEKEYAVSKVRNGYYIHNKINTSSLRLYHNKKPSPSSTPVNRKQLQKLKALYLNSLLIFQNIDVMQNFVIEYIGTSY